MTPKAARLAYPNLDWSEDINGKIVAVSESTRPNAKYTHVYFDINNPVNAYALWPMLAMEGFEIKFTKGDPEWGQPGWYWKKQISKHISHASSELFNTPEEAMLAAVEQL